MTPMAPMIRLIGETRLHGDTQNGDWQQLGHDARAWPSTRSFFTLFRGSPT